jgi:probable addiction module antidote protein
MKNMNSAATQSAPDRPHEESVVELLRSDSVFRAQYLNDVFADGDKEEILVALRRVAEAFGMARVAEKAHLNPTSLYRTLSPAGNPELANFLAILSAVGLKMQVSANT